MSTDRKAGSALSRSCAERLHRLMDHQILNGSAVTNLALADRLAARALTWIKAGAARGR